MTTVTTVHERMLHLARTAYEGRRPHALLAALLAAACGGRADLPGEGGDPGAGAAGDKEPAAGVDLEEASALEEPSASCDGATLDEIWAVDNGHGPLTAQAVSPGGRVALAAEDASVKLWDLGASGPDTLREGASPSAGVYGGEFVEGAVASALAFSPDGGRLAVGDRDGRVALWSPDDRIAVAAAVTGETAIATLAVDRDASLVVVAHADFAGPVRLWRPADGSVSEALPTELWGVFAVAFVGPGRFLLAGDWYGLPWIELWDAASVDAPVATWEGRLFQDPFPVTALAFDAASGDLLVAGGQTAFVARLRLDALAEDGVLASAVRETEWSDRAFTFAALSPDGGDLVTASANGSVRVWDARALEERARRDVAGPVGLGVDPAGRAVVGTADGLLHLFGCATR